MTRPMTDHRSPTPVVADPPAARPRPGTAPPSFARTTAIVSRGHLFWLGWTWLVTGVVFVAVMLLIIRAGGTLDDSLWESAGAAWQRYVIFAAGVTTLPSFLALFVANGVTRAQLAASSTAAMVVVAAAGTVVVLTGFVVESLLFGAAGWDHVLGGGGSITSGGDLALVGLRYLLLFCMWFSAGWLIGTGFYRYGRIIGICLIVPFAVPVLVAELLVGQGAAAINVDVLTDLVEVPAVVGLLVGVGLVALNATLGRAFIRGAAVHGR